MKDATKHLLASPVNSARLRQAVRQLDRGRVSYRTRILLCGIALGLAGCAHTRYVAVPCLTPQQYDKLKADKPGKIHDQLTGKADQDIRPITGRLVRMEGFADGLITVLGGCVG